MCSSETHYNVHQRGLNNLVKGKQTREKWAYKRHNWNGIVMVNLSPSNLKYKFSTSFNINLSPPKIALSYNADYCIPTNFLIYAKAIDWTLNNWLIRVQIHYYMDKSIVGPILLLIITVTIYEEKTYIPYELGRIDLRVRQSKHRLKFQKKNRKLN